MSQVSAGATPTSTPPAAVTNQINANQQQQDELSATALPTPDNAGQVLRANQHEQEEKLILEKRGWLMIVATLVASLTYQAAMNPPGGYWQDTIEVKPSVSNTKGHVVGTAVFWHTYWYQLFMISNTYVFAVSVFVIFSLMWCTKVCTRMINIRILETLMALSLLCLMVAYAAITGPPNITSIATQLRVSKGMELFTIGSGIMAILYLFVFKSNFVRRPTRPVPERELGRAAGRRTAEEA